jgi:hypothetical protein
MKKKPENLIAFGNIYLIKTLLKISNKTEIQKIVGCKINKHLTKEIIKLEQKYNINFVRYFFDFNHYIFILKGKRLLIDGSTLRKWGEVVITPTYEWFPDDDIVVKINEIEKELICFIKEVDPDFLISYTRKIKLKNILNWIKINNTI